jgi:hypothetical protein
LRLPRCLLTLAAALAQFPTKPLGDAARWKAILEVSIRERQQRQQYKFGCRMQIRASLHQFAVKSDVDVVAM